MQAMRSDAKYAWKMFEMCITHSKMIISVNGLSSKVRRFFLIPHARQKIATLEKESQLNSKALSDKDTLVQVLHKKGRAKREKMKEKCAELQKTTLSLRDELEQLKELSTRTEAEMKHELDEMEKQLHRAILQSEELEEKLVQSVEEKSALLEAAQKETRDKSAQVAQLEAQLATIQRLEKQHQALVEEEQKRAEEKILILRENERRHHSQMRHLQDEIAEQKSKIDELEMRDSEVVAEASNVNRADVATQYDGIEVTQVITEEITETVQRRIPPK